MPIARPASLEVLAITTDAGEATEPANSSGPQRRSNRDARSSARRSLRSSPYTRAAPTPSVAVAAQLGSVALRSTTRAAASAKRGYPAAARLGAPQPPQVQMEQSSQACIWPAQEEIEKATAYVERKLLRDRQRLQTQQREQAALAKRLTKEAATAEARKQQLPRVHQPTAEAAEAALLLTLAPAARAKETKTAAPGRLSAQAPEQRAMARVMAKSRLARRSASRRCASLSVQL